jgi:hypothetical protein
MNKFLLLSLVLIITLSSTEKLLSNSYWKQIDSRFIDLGKTKSDGSFLKTIDLLETNSVFQHNNKKFRRSGYDAEGLPKDKVGYNILHKVMWTKAPTSFKEKERVGIAISSEIGFTSTNPHQAHLGYSVFVRFVTLDKSGNIKSTLRKFADAKNDDRTHATAKWGRSDKADPRKDNFNVFAEAPSASYKDERIAIVLSFTTGGDYFGHWVYEYSWVE